MWLWRQHDHDYDNLCNNNEVDNINAKNDDLWRRGRCHQPLQEYLGWGEVARDPNQNNHEIKLSLILTCFNFLSKYKRRWHLKQSQRIIVNLIKFTISQVDPRFLFLTLICSIEQLLKIFAEVSDWEPVWVSAHLSSSEEISCFIVLWHTLLSLMSLS